MRRSTLLRAGMLATVMGLAACANTPGSAGWATLVDGDKGLDNWTTTGDANWRAEAGAIVADKGKGGYLVSKKTYRDFEINAEFWAASDTNSGIFIRISDPAKIGADSSYEVNIWDIRPDPIYATGAIVNYAAVPVPLIHKAGGKWNSMQIVARGDELVVRLNGAQTVNIRNSQFPNGPIALQYGGGVNGATSGTIKWRKVEIRPL